MAWPAAAGGPTPAAGIPYRGRFAPSPTGPLHFGSLLAAVASYLDARANGGEWLVRIEDLDRERCRAHWTNDILRTLEAFGFQWDGEVVYQSRRDAHYQAALERLQLSGRVYPCACSRREIADSALAGIEGPVYPGTCRGGLPAGRAARALRVLTTGARVGFHDAIQGDVAQDIEREVGDFVIRRADGPFAYQLAVVADDADQGITHVVRGADLLASTPRQLWLQRMLGLPTPRYAHIPVAVNAAGEKLSKQSGAPPVHARHAFGILGAALALLGQPVPAEAASLAEFWRVAGATWRIERVPARVTVHGDHAS